LGKTGLAAVVQVEARSTVEDNNRKASVWGTVVTDRRPDGRDSS